MLPTSEEDCKINMNSPYIGDVKILGCFPEKNNDIQCNYDYHQRLLGVSVCV